MNLIRFSPKLTCHFWNVGQGLFSSGKITVNNYPTFSWVYDCGAAQFQSPNVLTDAIAKMNQVHTEEELDLVVISHFDEDHISGFKDLLKNRQVKHLLMPYYPLWQRLILAYWQGIDTENPFFEYFINPVAYLSEHYGNALASCTFLFVPAYQSEKGDEPIFTPTHSDNIENMELLYRITNDVPTDPIFQANSNLKVKFLAKNTALLYAPNAGQKGQLKGQVIEEYEFVPYTVDMTRRFKRLNVNNSFYTKVEDVIKNKPIQDVPALLKPIFKNFFKGKVQINKKEYSAINRASLFLYISEIRKEHTCLNVLNEDFYQTSFFDYYNYYNSYNYFYFLKNAFFSKKNAILYTGDGYLKYDQDISHFKSALGKKRFENIAVFQVPHHGAKGNNKLGLASKINPRISIFCANPSYSYGHPHSVVWFDFIHNIPILVDTQTQFSFSIS